MDGNRYAYADFLLAGLAAGRWSIKYYMGRRPYNCFPTPYTITTNLDRSGAPWLLATPTPTATARAGAPA